MASLSRRRASIISAIVCVACFSVPADAVTFPLAEPVSFGESLSLPTEEWSYFLGTDFRKTGSVGFLVGKPDATIIPRVRLFGVTIIPRVSADTRTGAKLTGTVYGKVGLDLSAGYDLGGCNAAGQMSIATHLDLPETIRVGQFFQPVGSAGVTSYSNFDLDLPSFHASAGLVCNVGLDGKFEYGLFPFVKYGMAPFDWGFNWNWDFFDFNLDLGLPGWPSLSLPGIPDFTLPDATGDDLMRIKLPPKNPAMSFAEVQLVNPAKGIVTTSGVADKSLVYTADGDLLRLGIDIDGIASYAVSGVSFTGTTIDIGVGSLTYDLIDVKYGPELGFEYEAKITPYLEVELTFEKPVYVRHKDSTIETVTFLSGPWNDLPELALTDSDGVGVDVKFTGIEALLEHAGRLTLTDYMEIRALYAKLRLGKGLKGLTIGELGPVWHKKFSILGALFEELKFDVFEGEFNLNLAMPEALLDTTHHFTLQATSLPPVYMTSPTGPLDDMSRYRAFSGDVPASPVDAVLVVATAGTTQPATNQAELVGIEYVDQGQKSDVTVTVYDYLPFPLVRHPTFTGVDDPRVITALGGLWVPPQSRYVLEAEGLRRLQLAEVTNEGHMQIEGWFDLHSDTALTFRGGGTTVFQGPGTLEADALIIDEGSTLEFRSPRAFRTNAHKHIATYKVLWNTVRKSLPEFHPELDVTISDHRLDITSRLDSAGALRFSGAAMELSLTEGLYNRTPGRVEVTDGGSLGIDTPLLCNGGRLLADGGTITAAATVANICGDRFSLLPPDLYGGTIEARNSGRVELLRTEPTAIGHRQAFLAGDGGMIRFAGPLEVADLDLAVAPGGTMGLNGLRRYTEESNMTITNDGLLVLESGLVTWESIDGPPVGSIPGQQPDPRSRIETIDFHNSGTVRIMPTARLRVDARITDYDGGGAALLGGAWELLGPRRSYSNLDAPPADAARMDIRIVEIKQGENVLTEAFDLEDLNTDLFYNLADVTLSGGAQFSNFNTIGCNIGQIRLANLQQFHTVGDLVNWGEITVTDAAGLHVSGDLQVPLGRIDVTDGNLNFSRKLEIIGGRVTVSEFSSLSGLDASAMGSVLLPGYVWEVHEATQTNPETGEVLEVTPGVLDLSNISIMANEASVLLEGEQSGFPALKALADNRGRLALDNCAALTLTSPRVVNAATGRIDLDNGALLTVQGELVNNGALKVGADSMLDVQDILTLDSPHEIILDGVIRAAKIETLRETHTIGSGRLVGDFVMAGSLNPGSSPGQMEVFGDVEIATDAILQIDLPAMPGDPHDKLIVHGLLTTDGSHLQLIFDPLTGVRPGGLWMILEAQKLDPADFASITVQGLSDFIPGGGAGSAPMDPEATLLGTSGDMQLLLYFSRQGETDTLAVSVVPEPATVAVLVAGFLLFSVRRRRAMPLR